MAQNMFNIGTHFDASHYFERLIVRARLNESKQLGVSFILAAEGIVLALDGLALCLAQLSGIMARSQSALALATDQHQHL